MFFTKKRPTGETVELKISGMHCSSCAMSIDGALEEIEGIHESSTSYAKQRTQVLFDPQRVSRSQIVKAISELGYSVRDA
ncbi:MAG: heavy metal-associated domain-containing protein [Patescibacteria group bacterium]